LHLVILLSTFWLLLVKQDMNQSSYDPQTPRECNSGNNISWFTQLKLVLNLRKFLQHAFFVNRFKHTICYSESTIFSRCPFQCVVSMLLAWSTVHNFLKYLRKKKVNETGLSCVILVMSPFFVKETNQHQKQPKKKKIKLKYTYFAKWLLPSGFGV